jgi:ADP-ribose pyrophosphatase YjhB (NUDIX family)
MFFEELRFHPPGSKIPAAGAVVVEPDGRVWLVSPTNQHGGAQATFPKGTVTTLSLGATALKEVFDKTGLQIELMTHLLDVDRTTSFTRYYLARRIGGTPAAMGWRSQAVHLVPLELVKERLNLTLDHAVIDKVMEVWGTWAGRYREPVEHRPSRRGQPPRSAPQVPPMHQPDDAAAKYAKQDADAIAALACAAFKANKNDEAVNHCKHAAVVLHHQGKKGLAEFFARFVKQATTMAKDVSSPPPPSLFEAPLPPPPPTPIRRQALPQHSPIFEPQAKFMATLILELEAACIRAYGLRSRQEIRWGDHLSPTPWDLPEYRRFVEGAPACGFVVEGFPPEEWLDLEDIDRHPERAVSIMGPKDIREYLHTLHRSEKWADGYSSPMFEALASGALQAVARRLLEDDSLYEPDHC